MTQRPRVSVVTVSYNQALFLPQALESVIKQDYRDVEHIVVDACSTDGSHEILRRYAPRLSRLIIEPDQGPADGLNKGFAVASGEIFAYINADDALLPRALSKAVQSLATSPSTDVLHAHALIVAPDGTPMQRFRSSRFDLTRFVYGGTNLPQQSTVFRAEAFFEIGGFNPDNHTCWDAELIVDLALAGARFQRINDFWSIFRIHPNSISGSGRLQAAYSADRRRIRAKVCPPRSALTERVRGGRARVGKFLADPRFLVWRVTDEFLKPALPA